MQTRLFSFGTDDGDAVQAAFCVAAVVISE
jgi:hypothetical protein